MRNPLRAWMGVPGFRRSDRAVVLVYHSVTDARVDPWAIHVSPRRFEEQMTALRREFAPLPLAEVVERRASGRFPRGAVAVTFDDGYANNLHEALPVLERLRVPATIFVTTGFVGAREECWWDALERLLLGAAEAPPELRVAIHGTTELWPFAAPRQTEGAWRAWEEAPGPAERAYRALWESLLDLDPRAREAVLESLADQLDAPGPRRSHLPLAAEELDRLASSALVEIGAHTVTHPVLARLAPDRQRLEIEESAGWLSRRLRREVRSFAYPFGQETHFSAGTTAIVRDQGFSCACINLGGVVSASTDPFRIPRVHVGDWDGDEFTGRLRWWLAR